MAKVTFNKLKFGDIVLIRDTKTDMLVSGIVMDKVDNGMGQIITTRIGYHTTPISMEQDTLVVERRVANIYDEYAPLLIEGLDKEQYNDAFNTIKEEGGRVKPNDFGFMVLCDGKEVDDIIIVEAPLGTEKIAFMHIMRAENGELMHDLNSGEYAYEEVFPRSVAEWNSILNYFNGQM